MRYFFKEMGFPQTHPTTICIDNLPFLKSVVGDEGASIKSKHIMIRLRIMNEAYMTQHIPSDISKLVPVCITSSVFEAIHQWSDTIDNGQRYPLMIESKVRTVCVCVFFRTPL